MNKNEASKDVCAGTSYFLKPNWLKQTEIQPKKQTYMAYILAYSLKGQILYPY